MSPEGFITWNILKFPCCAPAAADAVAAAAVGDAVGRERLTWERQQVAGGHKQYCEWRQWRRLMCHIRPTNVLEEARLPGYDVSPCTASKLFCTSGTILMLYPLSHLARRPPLPTSGHLAFPRSLGPKCWSQKPSVPLVRIPIRGSYRAKGNKAEWEEV